MRAFTFVILACLVSGCAVVDVVMDVAAQATCTPGDFCSLTQEEQKAFISEVAKKRMSSRAYEGRDPVAEVRVRTLPTGEKTFTMERSQCSGVENEIILEIAKYTFKREAKDFLDTMDRLAVEEFSMFIESCPTWEK